MTRWRFPASILCFHGIAGDPADDNDDMHVTFDGFKSVVALARQLGEIVPLRELLSRHSTGRSTDRLFAVTFDDAYVSLLGEPAEFLRREQVPATVFVTTGAAQRGDRYWWDRLHTIEARLKGTPPHLRENNATLESGFLQDWKEGRLRRHILGHFGGRLPDHLDAAFSRIEEAERLQVSQRSMTYTELGRLRQSAPVEIGVHTVTHPVLPLLSTDEQRREVQQAARSLHSEFDRVLDVLAVPYGLFNRHSIMEARRAGMDACLTLSGTTLRRSTDGAGIPRFCVMRRVRRWKLLLRLAGAVEDAKALTGRLEVLPVLPTRSA